MVILGWEMAPSGQGDDLPAAQAAVEPGKGRGLVRIVDGVEGRAARIVRVLAGIFRTTLRRMAGSFQLMVRVMGGHSLTMVQVGGNDIPALLGVVAGAFTQLHI